MTVAELVSRLVEAGATPEMIKIAVEAFDSQRVAYETMQVEREAEEKARKQSQRERTTKSRQRKKGVTNNDTPVSRDGNVTGTLQGRERHSDTPSEVPPKDNNSTPLLPPPVPMLTHRRCLPSATRLKFRSTIKSGTRKQPWPTCRANPSPASASGLARR